MFSGFFRFLNILNLVVIGQLNVLKIILLKLFIPFFILPYKVKTLFDIYIALLDIQFNFRVRKCTQILCDISHKNEFLECMYIESLLADTLQILNTSR
jgi:hypothetical protein